MHYTSQETIDLIVSLRKEGKNYTQIREATGCSKGTISKYCTQYGVSKDPRKVNEITPDLLQEIQERYNELKSLKKVAKEYHISAKRLRIAGIEILNPQKTKEELTSQASCARKTKLKAIEYKGGKCIVCGYNKSIRALQFSSFRPYPEGLLGLVALLNPFEKLKPELDKCVLLCANCHGEVHEGLLDINKFI
jgi:hypothetical protein